MVATLVTTLVAMELLHWLPWKLRFPGVFSGCDITDVVPEALSLSDIVIVKPLGYNCHGSVRLLSQLPVISVNVIWVMT